MSADHSSSKEIADLQKRLADLDQERANVLAALERVQSRAAAQVQPTIAKVAGAIAGKSVLSNSAKVALFRSLFRGRDDVFPRRWENSKTGKSGYAPACRNEWIRGIDMIFNDVLLALEAGRSPVVITERKDHLQAIAQRLAKFAKNVIILKGGMGAKQRHQVIETLQSVADGEERVIVATGRYLGEGFDDARLDTLFLTMPISWRGILAQYAGRLHRLHATKREAIIFDYVDADEPLFAKMATRRAAGYRALGYEVIAGDLLSRETTNFVRESG